MSWDLFAAWHMRKSSGSGPENKTERSKKSRGWWQKRLSWGTMTSPLQCMQVKVVLELPYAEWKTNWVRKLGLNYNYPKTQCLPLPIATSPDMRKKTCNTASRPKPNTGIYQWTICPVFQRVTWSSRLDKKKSIRCWNTRRWLHTAGTGSSLRRSQVNQPAFSSPNSAGKADKSRTCKESTPAIPAEQQRPISGETVVSGG